MIFNIKNFLICIFFTMISVKIFVKTFTRSNHIKIPRSAGDFDCSLAANGYGYNADVVSPARLGGSRRLGDSFGERVGVGGLGELS